MSQPGYQRVQIEFHGRTLTVETGRMAKQAGGATLVQLGESVVLVTATALTTAREGIDFFPLTCDYQEKTFAAGKIPGGEGLLLVVAGEGEEVDALARGGERRRRDQDDGLAELHEGGPPGLLGHAAGLDRQGTAVK